MKGNVRWIALQATIEQYEYTDILSSKENAQEYSYRDTI